MLALVFPAGAGGATEVVRLAPENWDAFAPEGKEVDAIFGDLALRNGELVAVIGNPVKTRHANWSVRDVGGALIDLTLRESPNDQLSALYPVGRGYPLRSVRVEIDGATAVADSVEPVRGGRVDLVFGGTSGSGQTRVEVRYRLEDGWKYLQVSTVWTNLSDLPQRVPLSDRIRADGGFDFGAIADARFAYAYDTWFGQAYAFMPVSGRLGVQIRSGASMRVAYGAAGVETVTIPPGGRYGLERRVIPGRDLFEAAAIARRIRGLPLAPVTIAVSDAAGPVADAEVLVGHGDDARPWGRTRVDGTLEAMLAPGAHPLRVRSGGRGSAWISVDPASQRRYPVLLAEPAWVSGEIRDESGNPIPCKVQLRGLDETPDPNFFPDTGSRVVRNVIYTHDGIFRRAVAPGHYEIIVSRGPEYDAIFKRFEARAGEVWRLRATLVRSVDTTGWISADLHSHTTYSGDTTASPLGRVLNLLSEHVEFVAATEHNRIVSYRPLLRELGAEHLMATAAGLELTGRSPALNHQIAFPLTLREHTQDGGAPRAHRDPAVQIRRLAELAPGPGHLVQLNHPDILRLFFDGGDARAAAVRLFDVVEIYPVAGILAAPIGEPSATSMVWENRVFHWLQLINLGYRLPGVLNSDAHLNFHGSGWRRNYIRSASDEPSALRVADIANAARRGNVVMSTGPFLEVIATTDAGGAASQATAGDEIRAPDGRVRLRIRVQCPNWFDVDRVQVLRNGRPDPALDFTRKTAPDKFRRGTVKFDESIDLALDGDAHLIVVAAGETSRLGPVMGPRLGPLMPIAVANPVFVDVDGGGFDANGDTLGWPMPSPGAPRPR